MFLIGDTSLKEKYRNIIFKSTSMTWGFVQKPIVFGGFVCFDASKVACFGHCEIVKIQDL